MQPAAESNSHHSQIFLSHSGADTPAARHLANMLRRNGLNVWFDQDDLRPGDNWMATLEDAISTSSAMLVYVGRLGVGQRWTGKCVEFRKSACRTGSDYRRHRVRTAHCRIAHRTSS
jgi:hypothetical protein